MQADAAVVVYSVTDQSSLTAALAALGCIRKYRPATSVAHALTAGNKRAQPANNTSCSGSVSVRPFPVLILGNKSDLDHVR